VSLLGGFIKCFDDICQLLKTEEGNSQGQEQPKGTSATALGDDENNMKLVKKDASQVILFMIAAIPQTGRFSLNVQFMEEKDKDYLRGVLNWLEEEGTSSTSNSSDTAAESAEVLKVEGQNIGTVLDMISKVRSQFKL
jgi:hypothetical protein